MLLGQAATPSGANLPRKYPHAFQMAIEIRTLA
ncbi:hypothetical protein X769_21585 [Mesorhizobium sp. LSJC268A00]|nr:hypothetical protein X769_21585 [Mesorhizobium sp. LSJC268A00]ESX11314.1 hypothetical protein X768_12080 [Mesorhizobium sp. LSJC265A00]ESZ04433.1 hypothetical protein X736_22335 [Mesorhizobium sp. L2C089B000]